MKKQISFYLQVSTPKKQILIIHTIKKVMWVDFEMIAQVLSAMC